MYLCRQDWFYAGVVGVFLELMEDLRAFSLDATFQGTIFITFLDDVVVSEEF